MFLKNMKNRPRTFEVPENLYFRKHQKLYL